MDISIVKFLYILCKIVYIIPWNHYISTIYIYQYDLLLTFKFNGNIDRIVKLSYCNTHKKVFYILFIF